jgi:hypothetical protein
MRLLRLAMATCLEVVYALTPRPFQAMVVGKAYPGFSIQIESRQVTRVGSPQPWIPIPNCQNKIVSQE